MHVCTLSIPRSINGQHMRFWYNLDLLKACVNVHTLHIDQDKKGKIVTIFLTINFNMCFGCSKEPSH